VWCGAPLCTIFKRINVLKVKKLWFGKNPDVDGSVGSLGGSIEFPHCGNIEPDTTFTM
jgi:hypothetical protein